LGDFALELFKEKGELTGNYIDIVEIYFTFVE
jgi:hypothetical protein